jgi:hypothetical protein
LTMDPRAGIPPGFPSPPFGHPAAYLSGPLGFPPGPPPPGLDGGFGAGFSNAVGPPGSDLPPGALGIPLPPPPVVGRAPRRGGSAADKRRAVRKWKPVEDELLTALVREYGTKHWGIICTKFEGRTGKQVRLWLAGGAG